MKIFLILSAVLLMLYVDMSEQIPRFVNCSADFVASSSLRNGCGVVTCHGPDRASGVGCGTWNCDPEKILEYREADSSKPYPDCCGGPVCAD